MTQLKRSEEIRMRAVMLSEAEGTLEWNIALVGMCYDEEALILNRLGGSQDKTQPHRNLAGGSEYQQNIRERRTYYKPWLMRAS